MYNNRIVILRVAATRWSALAVALLFLVVTVTRAIRVPLTYDEAASYIRYIDTSVPTVFDTHALSVFNFEVATNHFLNTLLAKMSWLVAGGSELALRLPNLVAHVLYLAFGWALLRRCAHRVLALAWFVTLNANPYLLEFFALERGYGLSIGCLAGSLFFLLRSFDPPVNGDGRRRDVSRALAFANAAVLANFSTLNAFAGVFAMLLLAAIHHSRAAAPAVRPTVWQLARRLAAPVVAGTVFAALVFSQDATLSPALYRPVTVTLGGLDSAAADAVDVAHVDLRGRQRRLTRDPGTTMWRTADNSPCRSLRIEAPVAVADRVAAIQTLVGTRLFADDPRSSRAWRVHEEGGRRVYESEPSLAVARSRVPGFASVINWAGDARYAAAIGYGAFVVFVLLAGGALGLAAVGGVIAHMRWMRPDYWFTLASGALWTAGLAGPPLYELRRLQELYFGGTQGVVADTFVSTLTSSFEGQAYLSQQVPLVMAFAVVQVMACGVVAYVLYRRGAFDRALPALVLFGVIGVGLVAQAVGHATLGTPYLMERTALSYVPLAALFAAFTCDAMSRIGPAGARVAIVVSAAVAILSAAHFVRTVNASYVWDWKQDACTRIMIEDVQRLADIEPLPKSRVAVAVESVYSPVAVYYARMIEGRPLDIVPPAIPADFYYGRATGAAAHKKVVRSYRVSGTLLARPAAP